MNLNTLTPSAKMLKKLQNYSTGQPVTSGDVPNIVIINTCDVLDSKRLVENTVLGIKSQNANFSQHYAAQFGYSNKLNPMTAKFAESFRRVAAANAEAIIKANMADGVVIVTECDITASGILLGCLRANCPAVILPLGVVDNTSVLTTAGEFTGGKINSAKAEEVLCNSNMPKGQSDALNSVSTFFILLESIGLCTENASLNRRGSGAQLVVATKTGEQAVSMAKDMLSPKKLITKKAFQAAVELCLKTGGDIGALFELKKLAEANDNKITHEFINDATQQKIAIPLIVDDENQTCTYLRSAGGLKAVTGVPAAKTARIVLAKGTAANKGGYIQYNKNTVSTFSGKAWVYANLEDADSALLRGSIPAGSVIVLQNCIDMNVTALAYAIEGIGHEKEIAIVTDGVCDKTNVLAVMCCLPSSLENEEFANIQNGDVLDIDLTRGRFNTSILAKDQKTRAKRNTVKKQVFYF